MAYQLDVTTIREAARGHWDAIFCALAPTLKAAMQHPGKHVPCPVHGGKDGFRLFEDYREAGSCVCNTCGNFRDGFAALQWLHGWSFAYTLSRVASVLGLQPRYGEEVLERKTLNRVYRGHILFMGMSEKRRPKAFEGFVVEIDDELSKSVRELGTRTLKMALAEAGIKPHERVEIVLVARERVRRFGGACRYRYVWCVKHLASRAREELFASEKLYFNGELARNIREHWLRALKYSPTDERQQPMQRYLQRRAIDGLDESILRDLRFEERSFDRKSRRWYPAMLAAVRDVTGQLVTLHRTLLTPNGLKAEVSTPKRLMRLPEGRTISGCAIHFGEPHEVLAVAEGIETALSVALATGLPTWSCISATGLQQVVIPSGIKRVLIFSDKDRSCTGERSAQELCCRLQAQGIEVAIEAVPLNIPKAEKGIDWNDVLVRMGPSGFPDAL